ncbi:hypothetical protein Psch_03188 [Pelotomaculum schinkii]|uniref:SEC-C motif protein n=1 Tax=Pelotomaculum schinkii TaxID=78350 RepID=A0A4Y7RAX0_9FIRM|nr:SEC-C domain-containing protein [Pelotomaculum schinkii]TEB06145.1 hypothetical protein Psch_03188 [Pelotomaculum schinkii]
MSGTEKSCPCGSGKPYLHCCSRKVFPLDQIRWRHTGQDLRRRLGDFADQPFFAWEAARAQDLYLGCMDQQLVDRYDDFTMERCFEWFIFDYKLSSGKTVIETFWQENLQDLGEKGSGLARDWANSPISLYEVTMALPGEGLLIRELLGRGVIRVHDVNAASEIESGSILLMRVLKVGEEYEFSTSGLALPGNCKEALLNYLYQDRQEYFDKRRTKARGWRSYLKERAHKINAYVLELGASGAQQDQDSPGKSGLERMAVFAVENWQEALEKINQSGDFTLLRDLYDSSGGFRQAAAALLGRSCGKKPLRVVIGHLLLTPKFMVITVATTGFMQEARRMLIALFQENIVESIGRRRERPAEGMTAPLAFYSWPEPGYAAVADRVQDGLKALGYGPKQQKGALKLWYDFCSKEQPSIRKTAVWAATVIYAFSRLENEKAVKQQDLAGQYGVASSTISSRFRLLCQSLQLVAYDNRYTSKKPPLHGCRKTILF